MSPESTNSKPLPEPKPFTKIISKDGEEIPVPPTLDEWEAALYASFRVEGKTHEQAIKKLLDEGWAVNYTVDTPPPTSEDIP